jgi:DNA-binding Lrp family transcriptional regulator
MPPVQLNDTDRAVLEILDEGRNAPSNIADRLDFTRQYVQQRLRRLEEHGHVQNIGSGVYEIIDDPRDH